MQIYTLWDVVIGLTAFLKSKHGSNVCILGWFAITVSKYPEVTSYCNNGLILAQTEISLPSKIFVESSVSCNTI